MKPVREAVLVWASILVVSAGAFGQGTESQSIEGRLLDLLRDKGVINDAEHAELIEVEREMRGNDDIERALGGQIETLMASLEDTSPRVSYKTGKGVAFTTSDDAFSLRIGARIQVRFTYDFWDDNPNTDDESEPDFDVQRARLTFSGNAFEKYIKFKFQVDVAGDEADTTVSYPGGGSSGFSSKNRLTELKDAFVDFAKWSEFSLRFGQFKTPYSRQQLTSSGKLEFTERSIINKAFGRGRDNGLMVFGTAGSEENSKLLEYYMGIFDGEGENKTNNDKGLMYVARIAVNPFGPVSYAQSDTKHTQDFVLGVGANVWLHQDDNHAGADDDWAVGFDIAAFWQGFFATVELHFRENGVSGGPDVESWGWLAQAGYFLIPHELEISVLAANVDWDNNGSGSAAQREYLMALGYFWAEHNMKIQLDFGRVEHHFGDHSKNQDDWRLRLQFQLVF